MKHCKEEQNPNEVHMKKNINTKTFEKQILKQQEHEKQAPVQLTLSSYMLENSLLFFALSVKMRVLG